MAGLRVSDGLSLDLLGLVLPTRVLLGRQVPCLACPFRVLQVLKGLSLELPVILQGLDCQDLVLPILEFQDTLLPGVEVVVEACCPTQQLRLLQLLGIQGKQLRLLAERNLKTFLIIFKLFYVLCWMLSKSRNWLKPKVLLLKNI